MRGDIMAKSKTVDRFMKKIKEWEKETGKQIQPIFEKLLKKVKDKHPEFSDAEAKQFALELIKAKLIQMKVVQRKPRRRAVGFTGYIIADTGPIDITEGMRMKALREWAKDHQRAVALGYCFDDGRVRDRREFVRRYGKLIPNPNYQGELKPEWRRTIWFILKYLGNYRPAVMNIWGNQATKLDAPVGKLVTFKALLNSDTEEMITLSPSQETVFTEVEVTEEWDMTPAMLILQMTSDFFDIYSIDALRSEMEEAYLSEGNRARLRCWVRGLLRVPDKGLWDEVRKRHVRHLLPSDIDTADPHSRVKLRIREELLGSLSEGSEVLVYGDVTMFKPSDKESEPGWLVMEVFGMHPIRLVTSQEALEYSEELEQLEEL